jgi:DNA-binding CsgD family transcriptional regulator
MLSSAYPVIMSHKPNRRHTLSAREREILLWACKGKTYAEISLIVGLATGTIKTYLDHARLKLNVANLAQACAVAVAQGVYSREDIMAEMDRQAADRAETAAPDPANTPPQPQSPPSDLPPRRA